MSQLRMRIGGPLPRSRLHAMLGEADRRAILASGSAYFTAYSDARNSSNSGFGPQGAPWRSERSTVFQNASRACRCVFRFALVYRKCAAAHLRYLHADMQLKERALAHENPSGLVPDRYRPPDRLLAFLEGL